MKQQRIREAEGEAEALLTVQKAQAALHAGRMEGLLDGALPSFPKPAISMSMTCWRNAGIAGLYGQPPAGPQLAGHAAAHRLSSRPAARAEANRLTRHEIDAMKR